MTANGPVTWRALGEVSERVARLEQSSAASAATDTTHRNRIWLVVIGLMTGVVCPLVVTSVLTLLHLRGGK